MKDKGYKRQELKWLNTTDQIRRDKSSDVLDTGCSSHFLVKGAPCNNKKEIQNELKVIVLNGDSIHATHTCTIDLPGIKDNPAHILNNLRKSLISIGQLCDQGCETLFTKDKAVIWQGKKLLMTGDRDIETGMWEIDLNKSTGTTLLNNLHASISPRNVILYLHTA